MIEKEYKIYKNKGLVGFVIVQENEFSPDSVFLYRLYVKKEHRKKGFGRKLVETVLKDYPRTTIYIEPNSFEIRNIKEAMDITKTNDQSINVGETDVKEFWKKFGFKSINYPKNWMELKNENA